MIGAVILALLAAAVISTAQNAALKTEILVTGSGATVYEYASDIGGTSSCTNDPTYHCSKHWLPLLTHGRPKAAGHAKQSLLATTKRADGTLQVTYNKHPLYTWIGGYGGPGDKHPGDVNGQSFLGIWYVLSPAGKPIRKSYSPSP